MLAEACGKPFDEVLQDSSRTFYMSPDEAVSYGLIDKVGHSTICCHTGPYGLRALVRIHVIVTMIETLVDWSWLSRLRRTT